MALKGKAGATLAGRYRLLEQLGEGGMGSVWKAEHLLLRSHVAVKIVDPDVARLEFNLARFLREAKTLASLRSPNVVQVLDFGSDADTPYLVMELLHGQTLGRRLSERGRLSLGETCSVLQDVCAAMSLVHEQGLIHRDLKPENIFLCNAGGQRVTKVVDFGIAKSLRGDMTASMKTRTGHMLGTPSYMSPEQCRGLKDIDHRADLWALGVIAYECLVGKVPFEGEVLGDLLLRICMDPLPVPSQRYLGPLPPAFDAWFAKAVHRDRTVRFQSALELARSLSELAPPPSAPLRDVPEPSRPSLARISMVPTAPAPRPAPNTETNTSVGLVRAARRGERRARIAAAAGVLVVMLFGVWALGRKRAAEPAVNVAVQSARPPFEVTPKLIRPRVPTGRRWTPGDKVPSNAAIEAGTTSDRAATEGVGANPGGVLPHPAPEGSLPSSKPTPAVELAGATGAVRVDGQVAPAAFPEVAAPPSNGGATDDGANPGDTPAASSARAGAEEPGAGEEGGGAEPPTPATPTPAPPAPNAEEDVIASAPAPSDDRQLSPPSPLRPLRGTAAPAAPTRARALPPSDEGIRYTR